MNIPAGQFDFFVGDEGASRIFLGGWGKDKHNIVIRGAGANGAHNSGTTLKFHKNININWEGILQVTGGSSSDVKTTVSAIAPRGSNSVSVEDASGFSSGDFVIFNGNVTDAHPRRSLYSRTPISQFPVESTRIKNGISLQEAHEIESVSGNTLILKSKIYNVIDDTFSAKKLVPSTGIGFEDLHFDNNFKQKYEHNITYGYSGIMFRGAVNSWITRCRFSNTTDAIIISGSHSCSVVSIIVDGWKGHYSVMTGSATNIFYAFIEDFSQSPDSTGMDHGVNAAGKTCGIVFYCIGGPSMRGPDCHGDGPRNTLYDNLHARSHEQNGGERKVLPHHLNGYIRWNNTSEEGGTYQVWQADRSSYHYIVEPIFAGYKAQGGAADIYDARELAHIESNGRHVTPNSLWESMMELRYDGIAPVWIQEYKDEHEAFFDLCYKRLTDYLRLLGGGSSISLSVDENSPRGTKIGNPVIITPVYRLSYRLSGEESHKFNINNSGQITVDGNLDYSDKDSYEFQLTARSDRGGGFSPSITVSVNISINDINERPYRTQKSTKRYVTERSPEGTNVGTSVAEHFIDPDGDTLTYHFYDDINHYPDNFELDSETGQITVKNISGYEGERRFGLNIIARENHPENTHFDPEYPDHDYSIVPLETSNYLKVYVWLQDGNDPPVFADSTATFSVSENAKKDKFVGKVTAADEDDDELDYTLSGTNHDHFAIGDHDGKITVAKTLDRETIESYTLTATATDSADQTDTITVTINVKDGTDGVAFSEGDETTRTVMENTLKGTRIKPKFAVTFTGPESWTTFSVSGDDAELFTADDWGYLKVDGDLDYEEETSHSVTLTVLTEAGYSDTIEVDITITDENGDVFADRTGIVKEAILSLIPGKTEDTVTEADLNNATGWLRIGREWIDDDTPKLREGDFDGLTSITQLDITNLAIKTLPDHIFSDLESLRKLVFLENSRLKDFTDENFEGLRELRNLQIVGGSFDELPERGFDSLRKLQNIEIRATRLSTLPTTVFEKNTALATIILSDNELASVPGELISRLHAITHLDLSGNEIANLPKDLIDGTTSLKKLYLNNNEIRKIPNGFFVDHDLDVIKIAGNPVDPLPINVKLVKSGSKKFKVVIPTGAPFDMDINVSADGATIEDDGVVRVEKGERESDAIKIEDATANTVSVNFSGDLPGLPPNTATPPAVSNGHSGYFLKKETTGLPLVYSDMAAPMLTFADGVDQTQVFVNYPNPFNPETWIPYQLVKPSRVSITIYDSQGSIIRTLDLGIQTAGNYTNRAKAAHWDGKNNQGERVASGVYFYHFKSNTLSTIKRMVILK